ncbi:cation-translocating P-type ATPase [Cognatilysobacter tabacisoli]|uniref:cation-translocating P-type ATPase n=1 Tax=Cognatilysobacter tabacisoli TaxID=2315424 RepID=UPI000E6AF44E|nr:cation-translocating P-type ATPase [Lysobacter tabacisoli]
MPDLLDATSPAPHGLTAAEAAARLLRDGPNLLPQGEQRRFAAMVWSVVREPMVLLLLGAAGVYVLLGDPQEAAALGASVLAVIGLTVYQQRKSEHALQALRDLSSPRARVLRDGALTVVAARELVVGDLVAVAEGDRVPADARLLSATDLHVDESMLTGESVPVARSSAGPDRDMRLHASTLVVRGHGLAEVTATGAATEVGRIGLALHGLRPQPSAMQREIGRAVAVFAVIGLLSCVAVVAAYVSAGGGWLDALLAGITLAISNIPEEFPVVLTVFLALGGWRMARHHALVRRPPAIEALGAIDVLCVDKTGTLTENRMAVAELRPARPAPDPAAASLRLLEAAWRASAAQPHDPMEQAIGRARAAACRVGDHRDGTCIREYPLSPARLAMVHVWRTTDRAALQAHCKGAPEAVAALCRLDAEQQAAVMATVAELAARGLRVLGVAAAEWPGAPETLPDDPSAFGLQWLGLVGLADPLRAGVPAAVAQAQAAGVRVLMLTGDHAATATAIASQAGLDADDGVTTGADIEALDAGALAARLRATSVFARVKPDHKLRLVQALRAGGATVAMTGDGVNDAPALMAADVGIAMGGRGTDVAREAASIVLLDDNFVTVVGAIGLGRAIYDNIRRAVTYILAVHVPITGLALLPLLLGAPMLLQPLHVVFIELIIDPSCSIVFERERAGGDVMRRPPRPRTQRLLSPATLARGLAQGVVMLAAVVAVYAAGVALALPRPQLGAMAFLSLVVGNLGLIALNRSGESLWQALRAPNRAFWIVSGVATTLALAVTQLRVPAAWFDFAPPPAGASAIAVALPLLGVALIAPLRPLRRGSRVDGAVR